MELKDIKIIIDLMKKNDLSVFEMEKEGFKIKLKKGFGTPESYGVSSTPIVAYQPPITAGHTHPTTTTPGAEPPVAVTPKGPAIVSPMVGTFYAAMSPDSPPYVAVGQSVEAMKVMNEIKAEQAGVVAEILVENGKPVQFGQPLFRLH